MKEKINNNFTGIAKRYSKALVDTAVEKNLLDETSQSLSQFYEIYTSSEDLQNSLNAPTIKLEEKKAIISELTKSFSNKIVEDFLFILAQEGRFNAFPTIFYYFNEELNKEKNIEEVEVKSVIELDEEQKTRLQQKLENKLGKKVVAKYTTTPDIIGGLVISYNEKTIDLSVKSNLENLKKQLK